MDFKIIDISKDLITSPVYPGDPAPEISALCSLSQGDMCNMASLKTTLHAGTHVDAPLHFISGGTSVSRLPLEAFIGECVVLEMPAGRITGELVDRFFPRGAKRVLIKSGGKAFFDKTGAEEAAYLGIQLIGTDSMSVGSRDEEAAVHRAFLGDNVYILENLNLSAVSKGKYFLLSQPVKIAGAEAAPARAVLLDGYIFWSK